MGEATFDWAAREARMRRGELFHALRVPDDCWIVIRVDGRSFHAYARKYERPFDPLFHSLCATSQA